jgi:hypothetical protein
MNRCFQAFVATWFFASVLMAPAFSSEREDSELSQEQLQGLFAAMPDLFGKPPSPELAVGPDIIPLPRQDNEGTSSGF